MFPLCGMCSLKTATKGRNNLLLIGYMIFFSPEASYVPVQDGQTSLELYLLSSTTYYLMKLTVLCCDTVWFDSVIPKFLMKSRPP